MQLSRFFTAQQKLTPVMTDQLLWFAARLYGLSAFSNRPTVLRTSKWGSENGNSPQLWHSV